MAPASEMIDRASFLRYRCAPQCLFPDTPRILRAEPRGEEFAGIRGRRWPGSLSAVATVQQHRLLQRARLGPLRDSAWRQQERAPSASAPDEGGCSQQLTRVPAEKCRPLLLRRPTRETRVQQLVLQVAEFCSLSFDNVDAFQQQGLTRRMLVFLRSLDDCLSYWEDEERHQEKAFQLLHLNEDDMSVIRGATDRALDLIDGKHFRGAYDELCRARPGLRTLESLLTVAVPANLVHDADATAPELLALGPEGPALVPPAAGDGGASGHLPASEARLTRTSTSSQVLPDEAYYRGRRRSDTHRSGAALDEPGTPPRSPCSPSSPSRPKGRGAATGTSPGESLRIFPLLQSLLPAEQMQARNSFVHLDLPQQDAPTEGSSRCGRGSAGSPARAAAERPEQEAANEAAGFAARGASARSLGASASAARLVPTVPLPVRHTFVHFDEPSSPSSERRAQSAPEPVLQEPWLCELAEEVNSVIPQVQSSVALPQAPAKKRHRSRLRGNSAQQDDTGQEACSFDLGSPLPVRNSFVHFDTVPVHPVRRSQSAPAPCVPGLLQDPPAGPAPGGEPDPRGGPSSADRDLAASKKKRRQKARKRAAGLKQTGASGTECKPSANRAPAVQFDVIPASPAKRSQSVPPPHPRAEWEDDLASASTCDEQALFSEQPTHGDDSSCGEEPVGQVPEGPPVPAATAGSEHCFQWTESADKLHSRLSRLMRKLILPIGEFVFTIHPECKSHGRTGVWFQASGGYGRAHVKVSSSVITDTVLSVQLGGEAPCVRVRHDFSKRPFLKVPGVLDLGGAVDASVQTFAVTFRFAAAPGSSLALASVCST